MAPRPTARPMTASTWQYPRARRSRLPRMASSPIRAMSSRAMAIWFWFDIPTVTSPPMPMRVNCWSSAATPSNAARSLPNPVSQARSDRRNCTSRSAKARRRSTRCNSSTGRKPSRVPDAVQRSYAAPQSRDHHTAELKLDPGSAAHRVRAASGERRNLLLAAQFHTQPPCQFLGELPGDAARARAARGRPFQRLALKLGFVELDAEMAAIALHHGKVFILAAAVKAEP